MKMTTSWAFASAAVVAILVAGCTTETADNSEGGVSTTGTAGGSAAGSAGAGGDTSTGGSGGGTGGSSDTDASGPMSACETCAYAKCNAMKEVDNCENDKGANGCALFVDDFYTCLKTADTEEKVVGCGTEFASMASPMGMSQVYVNDLSSCVTDTDPMKGCLTECGAVVAGTGDAGAHE